MSVVRMAAFVVAALVLQTTLARFLVRGSVGVDLVLVVVVYLSLKAGPTVGMLTGHRGGPDAGCADDGDRRHRRAWARRSSATWRGPSAARSS